MCDVCCDVMCVFPVHTVDATAKSSPPAVDATESSPLPAAVDTTKPSRPPAIDANKPSPSPAAVHAMAKSPPPPAMTDDPPQVSV